jgi:hypothetical protein
MNIPMTNPDTLSAALYQKTRQDGQVNQKDEDVMQAVADDIFTLAEKLDSANARSFLRTLATTISKNRRQLVSGAGEDQTPEPMGGAMMAPPMMGQPGAPMEGPAPF